MSKKFLVLFALGTSMLMVSCAPSEEEMDATATQFAANIFATQTAGAPTITPTPTSTNTATPTSTNTPTPTSTNTPTLTAAGPTVLTVDGLITFNTGPSSALGKGEQGYAEGTVSEEGGFGQAPRIGLFKGSYASTDGFGTGASIGHFVWRIFGEGDIHVARLFDRADSPEFQGTIIGGTGRFAGASGEYSAAIVRCCAPVVLRATFLFDKPPGFGS